MKTLKLRSEREQVVELCQRMDADGLTVGTSGNISLRDPVTGLIAVSPSGLPYGEMTVEDVVVVDIEGNVVEVVTTGRHDPCVGIRATPIAEAMMALVLMDQALRHRAQCGDVGTITPRIPLQIDG